MDELSSEVKQEPECGLTDSQMNSDTIHGSGDVKRKSAVDFSADVKFEIPTRFPVQMQPTGTDEFQIRSPTSPNRTPYLSYHESKDSKPANHSSENNSETGHHDSLTIGEIHTNSQPPYYSDCITLRAVEHQPNAHEHAWQDTARQDRLYSLSASGYGPISSKQVINLSDSSDNLPSSESAFPDCPICSGKQRLQIEHLTKLQLLELKSHILRTHFPWFLSIEDHRGREIMSPYRTPLSEKLHPALCTVLETGKKLPEVFQFMWGKLIHYFLQFVYAKLGFKTMQQLVEFACAQNLQPTTRMMAISTSVSVLPEESEWVKAHQLICPLSKDSRIDFLCPTEPPALLHWITITNMLSQLPAHHQHNIVQSDCRDGRELYKPRPSSKDMKPFECYTSFWEALEVDDINRALSMIIMKQGVLQQLHSTEGCGPVQWCMLNRRYSLVTALLFAGASAQETDGNGCSVFTHAVIRRDVAGVKVLIPWVPSRRIDAAMGIAKSEGFLEIVDILMAHLILNKLNSQQKTTSASHCGLSSSLGPLPLIKISDPSDLSEVICSSCPSTPSSCISSPGTTVTSSSTAVQISTVDISAELSDLNKLPSIQEVGVNVHLNTAEWFCPVCKVKYPGVDDLKEHVCTDHLPWYLAIGINMEGAINQSQLSQQLMPAIEEMVENKSFSERHPVVKILGKLLHRFINNIADLLGIEEVEDLLLFVKNWKLYDSRFDYKTVSEVERCLVECFRMFDKTYSAANDAQPVILSPPNAVCSLLHWFTLAGLVSKLPAEKINLPRVYQPYTAKNVLPIRSPKNRPNTKKQPALDIDEFHAALRMGDIVRVHELISRCPSLCEQRLDDPGGSTPLHYALSQSRLGIATLLLMFGASVDRMNKKEQTALKTVAKEGNLEAARLLLGWRPQRQITESYNVANLFGNACVAKLIATYLPRCIRKPEENLTASTDALAVPASNALHRREDTRTSSKSVKRKSQGHDVKEHLQERVATRVKQVDTSESGSDTRNTHDRSGLTKCIICKIYVQTDQLPQHCLDQHLPWYIGYNGDTQLLNRYVTKTGLFKTINLTLGKCCFLPDQPFMQLLVGQLAHELLLFIAHHLEFNSVSQLFNCVIHDKSMSKLIRCRLQPFDEMTINAHKSYTGEKSILCTGATRDTSMLLNHKILIELLARLPNDVRRQCKTYEKLKRPVAPMNVDRTESQVKMRLDFGDMRERFFDAITTGHVDTLLRILETDISLAKQRSPHISRSGAIAHALYNDQLACAAILYLYGADVNQTNAYGWTALHQAAKVGNLRVVHMLLDLGASVDLKTFGKKQLAHDLAVANGFAFTAQLLREKARKKT